MKKLIGTLVAFALAGPGVAQAQAWLTLPVTGESRAVAAIWADHTRIVARCDGGELTAFVSRPQTTPGAVAYVLTQRRPDDPKGAWWRLSEDGASFVARQPASFVRDLHKSGVLDIVVKSRDLPDWETTVALPEEAAPLVEVMSSCGVTPDLPMSNEAQAPIRWSRRPQPVASDYPGGAISDNVSGVAMVSCQVSPLGAPEDCVVLDEAPVGRGFGYAAAQIVSRGRLAVEGRTFDPSAAPIINVRVPFLIERSDIPELSFSNRVGLETEGMFPEQSPQGE